MLVHAENLGHWFDPEIRLFQGLTFDIDAGGIIGLSGPSGSGKSTVLTILAGWLRPAEGEVTTEADVSCTWIPQNPYGVARRTALEHVALPSLLQGATRAQAETRGLATLVRFDLESAAERQFKSLSGGEAQRLMLARASLASARLMLVDEPTAQLDRQSATRVVHVISELADDGRAVVIASHDPAVLQQCSTVIDLAPQ